MVIFRIDRRFSEQQIIFGKLNCGNPGFAGMTKGVNFTSKWISGEVYLVSGIQYRVSSIKGQRLLCHPDKSGFLAMTRLHSISVFISFRLTGRRGKQVQERITSASQLHILIVYLLPQGYLIQFAQHGCLPEY